MFAFCVLIIGRPKQDVNMFFVKKFFLSKDADIILKALLL